MKIDLNIEELNKESLKKLIQSEDDSVNTQFRVTKDGFLILSRDYGNKNLENILFRIETNVQGNGYVGQAASEDEDWVNRLFSVITQNWPTPSATYIDSF